MQKSSRAVYASINLSRVTARSRDHWCWGPHKESFGPLSKSTFFFIYFCFIFLFFPSLNAINWLLTYWTRTRTRTIKKELIIWLICWTRAHSHTANTRVTTHLALRDQWTNHRRTDFLSLDDILFHAIRNRGINYLYNAKKRFIERFRTHFSI